MLDQVQKSNCSFKDIEQLKKIIARMIDDKKVDPDKINDKIKNDLGL